MMWFRIAVKSSNNVFVSVGEIIKSNIVYARKRQNGFVTLSLAKKGDCIPLKIYGKALDLTPLFTKSIDLVFVRDNEDFTLRPATQNEIERYHYHSYLNNTRDNGYFKLTDEQATRLHADEKDMFYLLTCVNSLDNGSYMTVQCHYKPNFKPNKLFQRDTRGNFSAYVNASNIIYLPTPFMNATKINSNVNLPTWFRDDETLIIEGRPAVCTKCGKPFSRYKYSMDSDLCPSCNEEKIVEKKIIKESKRLFDNVLKIMEVC